MANFTVNSSFNIGTDISGVISDSYGDTFSLADLGDLMSINANFDLHMLKITPITNGGRPIYQAIPNGISGDMTFVRVNGNLTSMFTSLYSAFYNEGLLPHFTLSLNVLNHGGQVDEYIFPDLVFHTPDFGEFSGIEQVTQKLSFSCPTIESTTNLASILSGIPLVGALSST